MAIIAKSTQEFILIKEIRDGVIILKDGTYHMVLMISSLNFSLKAEDEQNAIIMQYQNFLNSLDFPIQIFIESRKVDIKPYILSLQESEKKQTNELIQIQIKEYVEFIKNIVKTTDIVSKSFYVNVIYRSGGIKTGKGGLLDNITGMFSKKTTTQAKQEEFQEIKLQLKQRADVVQQGLARTGVRAVALNTEELIELFYKLFNPGELEKEVVTEDIKKTLQI
jgi:type IV secretory pathway VirB4 component